MITLKINVEKENNYIVYAEEEKENQFSENKLSIGDILKISAYLLKTCLENAPDLTTKTLTLERFFEEIESLSFTREVVER